MKKTSMAEASRSRAGAASLERNRLAAVTSAAPMIASVTTTGLALSA